MFDLIFAAGLLLWKRSLQSMLFSVPFVQVVDLDPHHVRGPLDPGHHCGLYHPFAWVAGHPGQGNT